MAAASAHVVQYVQMELHAVGAGPAEVYDVRCIELPGFPDSVFKAPGTFTSVQVRGGP